MRPITLLLAVAACAEHEPILQPTVGGVLVEPGLGGEWDDPSAVGDYRVVATTIQAAINAANPGETVTVQAGTFVEDLVMRADVDVVGSGIGETIVRGTILFDGLATDARLSRVSVHNPGVTFTDAGITVVGCQAFIEEVEVSFWEYGILLQDADNSWMNADVVSFNNYGIWADDSDNLLIANGLFRSNQIAGITNYTGGGQVIFNTLIGNAYAASSQVGFGGAMQFGNGDTEVVKNNIVVSNFFGINCQDGCANSFGSNLVWGNNTNYANEASARGDDVNVDPQFADPANFNFRLSVGSAAIDAASSTNAMTVDHQGEPRPSGGGYDIGFDEYVQSGFELLISEVLANAAVETRGEAFEIFNQGGSAVDLAGVTISDGDDLDVLQAFQGGTTVLQAGAYAVVVDPDYNGVYAIPAGVTVLTTGDTNLGNGLTTSDRLTLYEADGSTVIATFSYPEDPGDGVSLEMIALAQGDVSGNWRRSACPTHRSLGVEGCFPPSGDPSGLIVTEIMANAPTDTTDEYVEIYNPTDLEIDASGLILKDNTHQDELQGFANSGTLIGPGEHALILDPGYAYVYWLLNGITLLTTGDQSLGNGLAQGDSVYLYKSDGTTLIDSFTFPSSLPSGTSWEKVDYGVGDAAGNWRRANLSCVRSFSPGLYNGSAGGICDQVLINEVMSNPLNEDRGEYIELYNAGYEPVDLAELRIVDNIQSDDLVAWQGGTTIVNPGAFALIIDSEYSAAQYAIPSGLTVVATADSSLGNNLGVTDDVSLWLGDHLIDLYGYPFNAGNGFSVERVQARATDAAENWVISPCPTGGSPGLANCAVGGNAGGSGSSLYELVVTEVMSNADNEDTGEFVEIYNYGSSAVDLALFVFWDGDELDTVHDFWGGTNTVLLPGEHAVLLDYEYDAVADVYGLWGSGALMLTTSDTTLGSGLSTNDEAFLLEPDGLTLIDSFTSPSNPGNAVSIEKIDRLGGDIASNWRATTCNGGHTAGENNCP
jgi:hypothetical protein